MERNFRDFSRHLFLVEFGAMEQKKVISLRFCLLCYLVFGTKERFRILEIPHIFAELFEMVGALFFIKKTCQRNPST